MTDHPLTHEQQRQWLVDRLLPDAACSDDPTVVRLRGPLSLAALADAFGVLADRHDSLRTCFPVRDGVALQSVSASSARPLPVRLVDLSGVGRVLSEARLGALVDNAARKPFDLETAPPWRVLAVRLSADEHVLSLTLHHLIADLWSVAVVVQELCTAYDAAVAGRAHPLPPSPPQPVSLAEERLRAPARRRRAAQRLWWRDHLQGVRPVALPADSPRPSLPNLSAHVHESVVDSATADALRHIGQRSGTTLFPVLIAGFASVIARWTGQTDITLVSVTAGRRGRSAERAVGLLTECLVLRVDLASEHTFEEAVRRSSAVVLDALDHGDVPFADLVALCDPGRDREPSPLRQLGLSLHNIPGQAPALYGVAPAPPPPLPPRGGASEADLWLEVFDQGSGPLGLRLQMDDVMFHPASGAAFVQALIGLLSAAAADVGTRVSDLPLAALPCAVVQSHPEPRASRDPGRRATTTVQRAVADILSLTHEPDPDDNFFRLGGTSLDASRLAARLSDLAGFPIGLYAVMTAHTLRGTATLLDPVPESGAQAQLLGQDDDAHHHLNDSLVTRPAGRRQ